MFSSVLLYLSIYFSAFAICLYIGHIFYSLFVPKIALSYQRIFAKSVIGIVLFTLIISLYHTLGKTILSLFLLILLYFIYEKQLYFKREGLRSLPSTSLFHIPKKTTSFYLITIFSTSIFLPGTVFFYMGSIICIQTWSI